MPGIPACILGSEYTYINPQFWETYIVHKSQYIENLSYQEALTGRKEKMEAQMSGLAIVRRGVFEAAT